MTHQRQRQDSRIPMDSDGPPNILDRHSAPARHRVILQELRDLARGKNSCGADWASDSRCSHRALMAPPTFLIVTVPPPEIV